MRSECAAANGLALAQTSFLLASQVQLSNPAATGISETSQTHDACLVNEEAAFEFVSIPVPSPAPPEVAKGSCGRPKGFRGRE